MLQIMTDTSTSRIEIIRQYLVDVVDYSGSLAEADGAAPYIQWNFQKALEMSFQEIDIERTVRRERRSQAELPSKGGEVDIATCMVELRLSSMGKLARSAESFRAWFKKAFILPIVAEEERHLKDSTSNNMWVIFPVRGHFDRFAELFRFKAWETVYFPDLKGAPKAEIHVPDDSTTS